MSVHIPLQVGQCCHSKANDEYTGNGNITVPNVGAGILECSISVALISNEHSLHMSSHRPVCQTSRVQASGLASLRCHRPTWQCVLGEDVSRYCAPQPPLDSFCPQQQSVFSALRRHSPALALLALPPDQVCSTRLRLAMLTDYGLFTTENIS